MQLFNVTEFISILSGTDESIDVEDWALHTNYMAPYHLKHKIIKNFWNVVKELNNDEKKRLLQFVTSTSRPPLNGFNNLQPQFTIQAVSLDSLGIGSAFKSAFSKKPTKDPLPSSATCFNTLKLPMYPNKKILREKLLQAIKEAKGFYLSYKKKTYF